MSAQWLVAPVLVLSGPALAQTHEHHAGHPQEAPAPAPEPEPEPEPDHAEMDHARHVDKTQAPPPEPDHGAMDHGHAGHALPAPDEAISEADPPLEALAGPLHAADAVLGPEVMANARKALAHEMGDAPVWWFQADRLETRFHQGRNGYLWDLQGFTGGDIDKLWFKSEGEGAFGARPEQVELQALWSRAVDPWWDLQLGLRQDLAGPDRTHLVIGVQGLAPYEFEIDAALFLSHKGDLTARVEAEFDQRLTQRLILQPRVELGLAAQDVPALGIGAGFDHAALGLRLRYEFSRQFAPYLGVEHEWKMGQSRHYARAAGDDPSATSVVAGVRIWF